MSCRHLQYVAIETWSLEVDNKFFETNEFQLNKIIPNQIIRRKSSSMRYVFVGRAPGSPTPILIYIYIQGERERERKGDVYKYNIHKQIYIYIDI